MDFMLSITFAAVAFVKKDTVAPKMTTTIRVPASTTSFESPVRAKLKNERHPARSKRSKKGSRSSDNHILIGFWGGKELGMFGPIESSRLRDWRVVRPPDKVVDSFVHRLSGLSKNSLHS